MSGKDLNIHVRSGKGKTASGQPLSIRSTSLLFNQAIQERRSRHWSRSMIPKVMEAKYEYEFTIHIRFSDGTEGNVDLSQEADIAPEFLYEKVKIPTRQLL